MNDFLIIGGGINGLLLARELAATQAEILLLEKSRCCNEASWAGGGIVSPLYPWRYTAPVTALSNWAQDFYPQLASSLYAETGINPEFYQTGLLMLDAEEEKQALSWAAVNSRRMELVGREFLYDREPNLGQGFNRGLWMPDVANIRNPRLGRALVADLAQRSNVSIVEECQVSSFELKDNKVVKVNAEKNSQGQGFEARKVILSTGAWSGLLAKKLGITLKVEPVKGQMLLYKLQSAPINSIVLSQGRYGIPRQDGHVLIGSTLEYKEFDKTPTRDALVSLRDSAVQLLPMLKHIEPVHQWAGLRPGAPGGIPFIGRVPGIENVYVNAGQFRNGLVLAPASARLMGDILLDRQPIVDPYPYRPLAEPD